MKAHVVAAESQCLCMKTSLTTFEKMIEPSDSSMDSTHAVALLKGLNVLREDGQFCDCVIQLHDVCPGRLFLAHRCVLAASSPVLASLLVRHGGALLDLKLTCLSSETTLEYLLDFIYTGNLPPKSQDDLLLSVAVALQVQGLIDDLMLRRKTPSATLNSRKRPFPETQHNSNPWSPPSPGACESPLPSCSSCEAVPVIRHAKACGILSPIQPTSIPNYDINFDMQEKKSKRTRHVENPSCVQHSGDDDFQNMACSDADLYEPKSKRAKIVLPSDVTFCHSPLIDRNRDKVLEARSRTVVQTNSTSPKTVYMSAQIGQGRHNDEVRDVQDLTLCDASKENRHRGGLHFNSGHEHGGLASYQLERVEIDHNLPPVPASCASLQLCDISSYVPVDSSLCIRGQSSDEGQHNVMRHLQSMANTQYPVHVPQLRHEDYSSPSWSEAGSNVQESVVLGYSTSAGSPAIPDSPPPGDGSSAASQRFSSEWDNVDHSSGPQNSCAHHTFHGQMRYHCFSDTERQATGSSDSDEEEEEEDRLCVTRTDAGVSGGKRSLPDMTPHASSSTSQTVDLLADPSETQGNAPEMNTAAQPYQCTLCERAFSQRGSLNRHMRSHLGVRPYSCPHCPMTFSRQYRVTEHMRVHQRGCEDFQRAGPA